MITRRAENYGKVLFSLSPSEESIQQSKQILSENCELIKVLDNPVINKQEKEAVIDSLFEKEICNFMKVLCENKCIRIANMIFEAYETIVLASENIIKAKLSYVTRPDDSELGQIKDMISNKYKRIRVELELQEDTSLIGGFVLIIGDTEYDKSIKGTLFELQKTLARR